MNISVLRGGTSKSESRERSWAAKPEEPQTWHRREGAEQLHPISSCHPTAFGHGTLHTHPCHANPPWKYPYEYTAPILSLPWSFGLMEKSSAGWTTHNTCNSKAVSWWGSSTDWSTEERPSWESTLGRCRNNQIPSRCLPGLHTGKTLLGQTHLSSAHEVGEATAW